jgi:glycosyltransferase involved in cell wall biosynthesis
MMKVLRILNRFNLGGPTHNASFLTKYLEPEFNTKLVAGIKLESEHGSEFILSKLDIEPIYIREMHRELSIINDFKAFLEIKKIIREFKPDIVHTHAAKSGALGRLAALTENVPIIVHTFHGHVFHSYFGKIKSKIYIFVERFLAYYSSKIIAISESQKEDLVHNYSICNEEKIEIIPLGFDLEVFQTDMDNKRKVFREQYHLDPDAIAIGIIGRLTKIKNHQLFLNSAKNVLSSSSKQLKFFIIGDGEEKQKLEKIADNLGIKYNEKQQDSNQLFFTSWVKEIDHVLAGLDIIALTSLNEGTPVTLIEAKASKKPIISTDVGGVKDIISHEKTGILTESDNIDDFSKKLKELVDNKELQSKIAINGFTAIQQRFSYKRLVKDMRSLYLDLLDNNEIN